MNTDIEDYTISDLLAILNIQDDTPTPFKIKDVANKLISNLKTENKQTLATFVEKARDKIIANLNYMADEDEIEDEIEDEREGNIQYDENTQLGNWWQNQYLEQADEVERTKPTDRKQKVDIFDKDGIQNNAFVMKRERLGVLQSHPIPVVQGTINPNLKNTIQRIVSVDSQYRSNIVPYSDNNINAPSFNTDFSFDLSERLNNVLSITLNSIQLPTTWYVFDESLGNTCFKYQVDDTEPVLIKLPSGNYTIPFLNWFFQHYVDPITELTINLNIQIGLDEVAGKIYFYNTEVISNNNITLIFYDTQTFNSCNGTSCGSSQMRINQNFGWSLGYRTNSADILSIKINIKELYDNLPPYLAVGSYYNMAQAMPNLYGPAYFLLVIDDYNNNRVNNGLVTITNVSNKLDLPSYYSSANKNANNTFATVGCSNVLNSEDPTIKVPYSSALPYMVKSSPRQLTQAQLYTANEILYNRTTYSNKTFGPSSADVIALIPLNGISSLRTKIVYTLDKPDDVSLELSQFSQPYIMFGPQLEANTRTYFGPVNIDRMRVRLLDDKGNLVNLNDVDWSFSLLVEQLYQY
jgi:hypothetical protein